MAELHEALKELGPVDFAKVPLDNLGEYLQGLFKAAELIANSVPLPPGGTDFESSTPAATVPNSASSSKEMKESEARPPRPHPTHAELQKGWGKPLHISHKDNPLGISVYKMAGKDRNGAWFARRSVHEGLSFTKFMRAMKWEFAESLAVEGGPGAGSVRGIGADRRLAKKTVDGVGQMVAYELSAQFPGPTTPREFPILVLTTETGISEKSAPQLDASRRPRSYMVVSKPVSHPDAPERSGYVRGYYESVELIREIPLHKGESSADKPSEEAELNPVEWIMITRSDPGGGIPRFMVERGTPSSIVSDAMKFLDWATGKGDIPEVDTDADEHDQPPAAAVQEHDQTAAAAVQEQKLVAPTNGHAHHHHHHHHHHDHDRAAAVPAQQPGVLVHLTHALEAGLDTYAPTAISSYAHQLLDSPSLASTPDSDSDSSDSSFASAEDHPRASTPRPTSLQPTTSTTSLAPSTSTASLSAASLSSVSTIQTLDSPASHSGTTTPATKAPLNSHDKEVEKLTRQQAKLAEKLAAKRAAEDEKLAAENKKDLAAAAADPEHKAAVTAKHDKEIAHLEQKTQKEHDKLARKKDKELRKAEDKRRKDADRDALGKVGKERDSLRLQLEGARREVDFLKKEVEGLRAEVLRSGGHVKAQGGDAGHR